MSTPRKIEPAVSDSGGPTGSSLTPDGRRGTPYGPGGVVSCRSRVDTLAYRPGQATAVDTHCGVAALAGPATAEGQQRVRCTSSHPANPVFSCLPAWSKPMGPQASKVGMAGPGGAHPTRRPRQGDRTRPTPPRRPGAPGAAAFPPGSRGSSPRPPPNPGPSRRLAEPRPGHRRSPRERRIRPSARP